MVFIVAIGFVEQVWDVTESDITDITDGGSGLGEEQEQGQAVPMYAMADHCDRG